MPNHSIDLRQSPQYAEYMRKKGWEVESIKIPGYQDSGITGCRDVRIFIRKISLLGSVIKIQRPATIPPQEKINKLAKKYRAFFVKVEPAVKYDMRNTTYEIRNTKYEPDTWPLLPTKTLWLDLRKPKEELWEDLDQDARYSIRKARKELRVMSYELGRGNLSGLEEFHQLLKETGREKNFYTPQWKDLRTKAKCFENAGCLILSRGGKKPVSGALILTHDKTAYYHQAATNQEGRTSLAGYLVLWEAIAWAKKQGCKTFDFEGIYDPRFPQLTKSWQGFTYFKKKFGGKEIAYPRPLIKYYNPIAKFLSAFHLL